MEVKFTLTVDDMRAIRKHRLHKANRALTPAQKVLLAIVISILLGGMAALSGVFADGFPYHLFRGFTGGFVLGIFFVVLVAVGALVTDTRAVDRYFADVHNRWQLGPRRVSISAEGFSFTSPYTCSTEMWSVVWKIETTTEYLFLYTCSDRAHVVPRRVFRDQQHFEDFLALARRYQQGNPPSTGIMTAPIPPTAITRDVP